MGGSGVRIRLDNAFGPASVTVGHATIAVRKSADAPVAAPLTLTFGGKQQVTMPAGGQAYSDPLPFSVPADSDLLVSHIRHPQAPIRFSASTGTWSTRRVTAG